MTTNKNKKQQTYRLLIVSLFLVLAAFFCFSNKSFAATKKTTLKKTSASIYVNGTYTISLKIKLQTQLIFILQTKHLLPKFPQKVLLQAVEKVLRKSMCVINTRETLNVSAHLK